MEVGSIIRKVNYRDKRPFGGYYQILRIGRSCLYIRFLNGKCGIRPMELSKKNSKYYVAYSHRRVLVRTEMMDEIFPKEGNVPKMCTIYMEPTKTMLKLADICSKPKEKPKFLIFGSRYSEKKVVTFEGVYKKIINGQPKIKIIIETIVGTYE
jgi:hypothetical protein